MKIEIIDSNKKLTNKDISIFEKKFSIKFPEDYKDFMLKYNGGKTNNLVFISDYNIINSLQVSNFLSLSEISEFQKLVQEDMASDQEEYMLNYLIFGKEHMLNIADTYNEVQICISYNPETYGKIYWIDSTHEEEFNLLSNSFEEFINNFSSPYASEFEEACENKDYNKAKELINNGFDLTLKSYYDDKSILMIAMEHKLLDVVQKIIETLKPEKIIFDAVNFGDIDILKLVLDKGYDVNERDDRGRTALFITTDAEKVKLLVDYGIDINIENNEGLKAINYLRPNKHVEHIKKVFEILIEAEEKIKNNSK